MQECLVKNYTHNKREAESSLSQLVCIFDTLYFQILEFQK